MNAATGETVWQYAPTFTTVPGGEGVFGPIRDGMKRMARTTRVLREAPAGLRGQDRSPQLADTLPGGGHYVNSVLIGYAPADDPQIAMAVVLEYGGGGSNAAPILRTVLDARLWLMIAERRSTPIGCAWAFCRFSASKSFPYRDFLQKEHVTF